MLTSKLPIIIFIIFLLFTSMSTVMADALKKGTWAVGTAAPTERTEVAVAAVEGKIYVVGGFSGEFNLKNALNFAVSNAVEVYDPIAHTWSMTTPLPEGRHHAGIASLNGFLYVIGGFTQSFLSVWHAVSTVYQFNPSTETWRELAAMPTARGALGITVYQNQLYAIGGFDGERNVHEMEVFDPQTNSWSPAASLPTPRDHLTTVTVGPKIYAIGGRPDLDYHRNKATVEEYDPKTNQWRSRTNLPTARSGITAGVINGRIYVLGGESRAGTFATNEMYTPDSDQWQTMAPMPTARHGLGSAVVDGRLYVLSGGPTPGASFSQANEIFTPPQLGER